MPAALQGLQKEVERLSDGELSKFCIWFNRYLTRYENEKHKDDNKGIPYKDVLQVFKRANLITGDKASFPEASSAGLAMAEFYKKTRVKGCRVDDDGDMLMAYWEPLSDKEFRLAYRRQLTPSPPPRGEDEIWALTVDMRFPMSEKLQRLGSGHKWFRALRHLEAFEHFVLASRVATAVEDLKPDRSLLSYQNVE